MNPASKIITALGGFSRVASLTGVHRTTPWKWTRPKSEGGTGGLIPLAHVARLLAEAERIKVDLCAEDFIGESRGERRAPSNAKGAA